MKLIAKHLVILIAFLIAGTPPAAASGLLISIGGLDQSGVDGSFEVLLTNTEFPGGTTYEIAGFSFELLGTPGSGLTFTAADYPTGSPPYIFDGTGQASLDPSIPLSNDLFPNTHFSGADVEFVAPSIAVVPGAVFSLGLVSFTSISTVTADELVGTIVREGTVISDPGFQSIPYALPNTAVPEPPSWTLISLAGAIILGLRRT
jgi:hypothetical protein